MEEFIGMWFLMKWRRRAAEVGVFKAAQLMRKQGVPLSVARLMLIGR